MIENADTIYLKRVFHKDSPFPESGIVVVMMYTTLVNEIKEIDYFAYESETIYCLGVEAEAIYSY
ncbi:MAG TPA: hypothetical protein DCX17_01645 [Firmicutes bacterium]|nr:hypothetical protein [Bacillota bacterium]